jgi:hypothetical protein
MNRKIIKKNFLRKKVWRKKKIVLKKLFNKSAEVSKIKKKLFLKRVAMGIKE